MRKGKMKGDDFPYRDRCCKIAGKIIRTDKFTSKLKICIHNSNAPGREDIPKSWLWYFLWRTIKF